MNLLASYMTKKLTPSLEPKDAFLSLSKGKGVDSDSPVYDVWIFENGHVIYNGIENVVEKGFNYITISYDDVYKLKQYISNFNLKEIGKVKGRDNPLNILKFNNKKIVFQSERISGNLLELSNLIEKIVRTI